MLRVCSPKWCGVAEGKTNNYANNTGIHCEQVVPCVNKTGKGLLLENR
jgi:hypothetical protein